VTAADLSAREVEVLDLLAEGRSFEEIGHRLGITWWTVRDHADNARDKLGAANRVQAVAMHVEARTKAAQA
jgi:DNA-binding CsgD family transcriptional regulator